jgi:hypothetical protein
VGVRKHENGGREASTLRKKSQADDGRLACRLRVRAGPAAPWAKIGLVNLDSAGKGLASSITISTTLRPQALVDPLAALAVNPIQFARHQRRYVEQNILNNSLKLTSEILATK